MKLRELLFPTFAPDPDGAFRPVVFPCQWAAVSANCPVRRRQWAKIGDISRISARFRGL